MASSNSLRSSLIRVYTVCHSTKYLKKHLHKKENFGKKKVWNKEFKTIAFTVNTGAMHVENINPCHAELIKMPCPLLIFSQSDYLIQVVDTNSHFQQIRLLGPDC